MLAVIEIAGKQFRVTENSKVAVPKLSGNAGDKLTLDKILVLAGDDSKVVGNPFIAGASVEATIVGHDREDKIVVFRKKPKKNFKMKKGHRQEFTTIQIDSIKH